LLRINARGLNVETPREKWGWKWAPIHSTVVRHRRSRRLAEEDCARLTLGRFSSVGRAPTWATEPSVQLDLHAVCNYLLTDLRQPDLSYSRFRQSLKMLLFAWDQSAMQIPIYIALYKSSYLLFNSYYRPILYLLIMRFGVRLPIAGSGTSRHYISCIFNSKSGCRREKIREITYGFIRACRKYCSSALMGASIIRYVHIYILV